VRLTGKRKLQKVTPPPPTKKMVSLALCPPCTERQEARIRTELYEGAPSVKDRSRNVNKAIIRMNNGDQEIFMIKRMPKKKKTELIEVKERITSYGLPEKSKKQGGKEIGKKLESAKLFRRKLKR